MQTSDVAKVSRWNKALLYAPTTGASATTARQDNLQGGVSASHQMAKTDLSRVLKVVDRFRQVGSKYNIPCAIIAALASRESRCGSVLDSKGYGDHGNGFGILQVDRRYHSIEGADDPTGIVHVDQAVRIFAGFLQQVKAKHPDWEDEFILKGAATAYNSGVSNVATKERMDIGTTGNDYGSDVIARAQFYSNHF
jgi:hypothetical protein